MLGSDRAGRVDRVPANERVDVGRDPLAGRVLLGNRGPEDSAEAIEAGPGTRGDGITCGSCSPSASSRRRRSSSQSLTCSGPSRSIWLSTTVITPACPASGIRYRRCTAASAYFCGSRTKTSMSASLMSRSTVDCESARTESSSGRSRRSRPFRAVSPESRALARAYRCLRWIPSQSSSGPRPASPTRTRARAGWLAWSRRAVRTSPRTAC